MKKRIIAAAFNTRFARYASVWPQTETVGEEPAPPLTPAATTQGPNCCECGADIYENGNKIGIMGGPKILRRINNGITTLKIGNTNRK